MHYDFIAILDAEVPCQSFEIPAKTLFESIHQAADSEWLMMLNPLRLNETMNRSRPV